MFVTVDGSLLRYYVRLFLFSVMYFKDFVSVITALLLSSCYYFSLYWQMFYCPEFMTYFFRFRVTLETAISLNIWHGSFDERSVLLRASTNTGRHNSERFGITLKLKAVIF
jgi:hypothetical protein